MSKCDSVSCLCEYLISTGGIRISLCTPSLDPEPYFFAPHSDQCCFYWSCPSICVSQCNSRIPPPRAVNRPDSHLHSIPTAVNTKRSYLNLYKWKDSVRNSGLWNLHRSHTTDQVVTVAPLTTAGELSSKNNFSHLQGQRSFSHFGYMPHSSGVNGSNSDFTFGAVEAKSGSFPLNVSREQICHQI